ncbi:MAG TPA: hypothetical protein VMS11_01755 [Solirubrobacterales bacterium]|nr:hypothetical protein [Solirubrobacterales bacterium]
MSLRLGRSEDGVSRASLRVEFRIGLDDLAKAAGYAIEFETCEHATIKPAEDALARLTRSDVLDAARTAFHEFGFCGFGDAAGENLDRHPILRPHEIIPRADLLARARELFPEFGSSEKEKG